LSITYRKLRVKGCADARRQRLAIEKAVESPPFLAEEPQFYDAVNAE
jgi:hypothetical protein